MTTIAVDFDGVIHGYSRGWCGGVIYDRPLPGAIEGIHTLMELAAVAVFTSRTDLDAVVAWLIGHGVPAVTFEDWQAELAADPLLAPSVGGVFWNDRTRVLVTNRKPPARFYLDDRAVAFTAKGGWEKALMDMEITPAETELLYLVTVTVPGTEGHNPKRKVFGPCPVSGEPCSDITGKHHTILVRSSDGLDLVTKKAREKYGHVTRVESVPSAIPF